MDPVLILSLIDRTLDLIHKLNSNVEDREEYVRLRQDVRHQQLELARSLGSGQPAGEDINHGVLSDGGKPDDGDDSGNEPQEFEAPTIEVEEDDDSSDSSSQ